MEAKGSGAEGEIDEDRSIERPRPERSEDGAMEVRIARSAFLKGLAKAQSVVDTRNVRPILGYVLLEAADSEVVLCATDIEVGIKVRYPAEVVEKGRIALSAKKLYEIVKELPREEVLVRELPNCWAEIVCGSVTFKLMGLPPDEFPNVAEISGEIKIEFTRDLLREMIERTLFAVSTDESRHHITGVFVQVLPASTPEDGIASRIRFVATDGHRLSIVDKPYPFETPDLSYGVIVPRKGFSELRKALDDGEEQVTIGFVENDGVVQCGNLLMTMRLIEGDFPNYQQVIPKEPDKHFVV
ncbi:MAG: DNA polymerase III subunit beta, partial [Deltaproteobacteria bacterium]